jgi:hypothetical protein
MRVTGAGISVTGTAVATGLTINTGAATVGYVWTATSTGGAGSWQVATGGAGAPFIDSTAIIKGSADATKLLAIEVDGLTTGTTRTLTPQNASYTIAGTNLSQSFSGTQTFSGEFKATGSGGVGSGVGADFIPTINDTFLNGSNLYRWNSVYTFDLDIKGNVVFDSSTTVQGNIIPLSNNAQNIGGASSQYWANVHATNFNAATAFLPDVDGGADVGSTTKYIEKVWTNRIDIKTQVIAPSGAAGVTGTFKFRNKDNTGECTVFVSGGITTSITGTNCT